MLNYKTISFWLLLALTYSLSTLAQTDGSKVIDLEDNQTYQLNLNYNTVTFFRYNIIDNSTLFTSLSPCSLDHDNDKLELFYSLTSPPPTELDTWAKAEFTQNTPKDKNTGHDRRPNDKEWEYRNDLAYGYKQFKVDPQIKNQGNDLNKLHLAIRVSNEQGLSGRVRVQVGVSKNSYLDDISSNTILALLGADSSSASVLINQLEIPDFSLENFQIRYKEFKPNRRLQSVCSLMNNNQTIKLNEKVGTFQPSIPYQDSTDQVDKSTFLYEAYLNSLKPDTHYVLYLFKPNQQSLESGIVWPPLYFKTQQITGTCHLARDLEFCSGTRYSVPIPHPTNQSLKESELELKGRIQNALKLYDSRAKDIYSNFTELIEQYDCAYHKYSMVRDCGDCEDKYKRWLCAITLPQCGDDYQAINNPALALRESESNVKPFIHENLSISSFNEIKPCADLCHFVVQSCPTKFNFKCPKAKYTMTHTYYVGSGPGGGSIDEYRHWFNDQKSGNFSSSDQPLTQWEGCNMVGELKFPSSSSITRFNKRPNSELLFIGLVSLLWVLY